jgi:hypothetical protein
MPIETTQTADELTIPNPQSAIRNQTVAVLDFG